jgi:hypothetical protein
MYNICEERTLEETKSATGNCFGRKENFGPFFKSLDFLRFKGFRREINNRWSRSESWRINIDIYLRFIS